MIALLQILRLHAYHVFWNLNACSKSFDAKTFSTALSNFQELQKGLAQLQGKLIKKGLIKANGYNPELASIEEQAQILGVSSRQIFRLKRRFTDYPQSFKTPKTGSRTFINRLQLESWMESHGFKSKGEKPNGLR